VHIRREPTAETQQPKFRWLMMQYRGFRDILKNVENCPCYGPFLAQ
jgi:hypothetical protein